MERDRACLCRSSWSHPILLSPPSPLPGSLYLKKHKGFIREAIKNGADVVPVFCYGNSKLFSVVGESSRLSMGLLKRLSRRIKASVLIFYGRLCLPIPIRHPLLFVVGKPLPVVQKDAPSKEEIAAMHGRWNPPPGPVSRFVRAPLPSLLFPQCGSRGLAAGLGRGALSSLCPVSYHRPHHPHLFPTPYTALFCEKVEELYYKFRPEWETRPLSIE